MSRVLVVGGVSWDTVVRLERFPEPRPATLFARGVHETVGSTGAGKALNLARLGVAVTLHALVGEDDLGRRITRRLADGGVTFVPEPDPQGTERHVNLMADDGGRISIFVSIASSEPRLDMGRLEALVRDHDLVVLNILNYCRRLIPLVRRHRKEIWCDIHDWDGVNPYHRDFVEAADVLFMSSDAMPRWRDLLRERVAAGTRLGVCTHGRDGSTAFTRDGRFLETPILPACERVDTNGAGDAFFAGFLAAHLDGKPVETCLRWATVTAGLCVSSPELVHPDLSAARVRDDVRKHFGAA